MAMSPDKGGIPMRQGGRIRKTSRLGDDCINQTLKLAHGRGSIDLDFGIRAQCGLVLLEQQISIVARQALTQCQQLCRAE